MSNELKSIQISYCQLFTKESIDSDLPIKKIEIPIIQRDYAQGRESKKVVSIRNNFLDVLFVYLKNGVPFQDLDFIYGDIEKKSGAFIPLDGQQRLTTLFLLHWYLALKDDYLDDFKIKNLGNFSYKTRSSSSEFCMLLSNDEFNKSISLLRVCSNFSLSSMIKDKSQYFSSWAYDPTVQSMLCMLDSIHEKFGCANTKDFYEKLTSNEQPIITFQFLPLKDYGLSDELYIKMNSRGKPLTDFENFKAKFESHIEKFNEPNIKNNFSEKIDTDWAKLFWAYTNNEKSDYDEIIMNFINTLAINYLALIERSADTFIGNKLGFSFDEFYGKLNIDFARSIIILLDCLYNSTIGNNGKIRILGESFYFNEELDFKKIISGDTKEKAYEDRLNFFAYTMFIITWKGNNSGFREWMRVISNLTKNTLPFNNEKEFINALSSISGLLEYSNNIYNYFKSVGYKELTGLNKYQQKEEKIKAHLIGKNDTWKDLIYKYEENLYFEGQLTFALAFSGIENYFDLNGSCEWSNEENIIYLELFNGYIEKVFSLFDKDGLKPIALEEYRLHRAILKKGNYLLKEGANYSFLIGKDRDISWKRLLLADGDNDRKQKRDFFKQIIDDSKFDIYNLAGSLDNLCYPNNDINDWRKCFIKYPELFGYLGYKKYIRYNHQDSIYLLKGSKISGSHAEVFSYSLYIELKNNFDTYPFEKTLRYYDPSGENEKPCIYLNNWERGDSKFSIDIFYRSNGLFNIKFFDRNHLQIENQALIQNIENILVDNKFMLDSSGSFYLAEKHIDEIREFMKNLCLSLKNICV